jgi:hypothetical protein
MGVRGAVVVRSNARRRRMSDGTRERRPSLTLAATTLPNHTLFTPLANRRVGGSNRQTAHKISVQLYTIWQEWEVEDKGCVRRSPSPLAVTGACLHPIAAGQALRLWCQPELPFTFHTRLLQSTYPSLPHLSFLLGCRTGDYLAPGGNRHIAREGAAHFKHQRMPGSLYSTLARRNRTTIEILLAINRTTVCVCVVVAGWWWDGSTLCCWHGGGRGTLPSLPCIRAERVDPAPPSLCSGCRGSFGSRWGYSVDGAAVGSLPSPHVRNCTQPFATVGRWGLPLHCPNKQKASRRLAASVRFIWSCPHSPPLVNLLTLPFPHPPLYLGHRGCCAYHPRSAWNGQADCERTNGSHHHLQRWGHYYEAA